MYDFLQTLLIGVLTGSIYALLGLAIVVIFKSTYVFNLAQGGLLIMGGYFFYMLASTLGLPTWAALPLLLIFGIIMGMVVERLALRPLIGQPILAPIIVTLALLGLFQGVTMFIWGATPRNYSHAVPMGVFILGEIRLNQMLTIGAIAVAVLVILFALFFRYHKMGLAMRATAEEHQVAQALGISVKRIFMLCWVIAAMVGVVTGLIMGATQGLHQYLHEIGLMAFAVVLVGGLESLLGAVIGGLLVGVTQALVTFYVPVAGLGELMPWVIVLLVLLVKPYGLWGLVRIERI